MNDLIEEIRTLLGERIHRSGAAFYSCANTVTKGKYLILGLNPGGTDTENRSTIAGSLQAFLDPNYNAFYQEDWDNEMPQKTVKSLAETLGVELRTICSTNLVYERSRNKKGIDPESFPLYRDILDRVINTVQPATIFVFGNDALEHMMRIYSLRKLKETAAGHGSWQLILYQATANGKDFQVLYIPHFSYYALYTKPEPREWIANNIKSL